MKIIFMGTPDYASAILQKIINTPDMQVVAVYTQPDKPVGRKKIITPPPVKVLACENNIEVYQPTRLRDEETVNELLKIDCDYIIVAAYGQILPKSILDHAPCINLHASILPQYRGASPIQQSLLNGDEKTGVTAMHMDEGLDTGDIIKISEIDIDKDELVESLFDRLTKVAAELTIDVLQNYNAYVQNPQNSLDATHCKKILKADGEVLFDDAKSIYDKYRAFYNWPGVFTASGLKLKEIALESKEGTYRPGEILTIDKESIVVGCDRGKLRIFRVQPVSKNEMDIASYINGKRLNVADTLF
ncbi:MAG: methionyl-tRNA formyltransferase [Epsilonproteobacteria bacterium]|nr:methionyl-tRNA formyltransferase [Campylobacterota bacterium]